MPNTNVDKLLLSEEERLWGSFCDTLKAQVNDRQYATWFTEMQLSSLNATSIAISFPDKFACDWVRKHFVNKINKALAPLFDIEMDLKIEHREGIKNVVAFTPLPSKISKNEKRTEARLESNPCPFGNYRFENFVSSGGFQMGYTIAEEVAKNPGQVDLNPLIIYGHTGMGKTHLANAVGTFCWENKTAPKVVFMTSEEFLNQFVAKIRKKASQNSKSYYGFKEIENREIMGMSKELLECDLLIVDDIQFFVGKPSTQDHFCQILNALTAMKKQVVVTCDQDPQSFHQSFTKSVKRCLDERMLHKFRSGMTVEVAALEPAVREEIFRQKIQEFRTAGYLNDDVIRFLADMPLENVRELEGVINKLFAYKELMKREITLEMVRVVMGDTARNIFSKRSVESILKVVSERMGVSVEMIVSHSRIHKAALPRKVAMYLSRELTDNSLHTIGLHFNRDYSTVIFNLKALVKLMERDPELAEKIRLIKEKILNP